MATIWDKIDQGLATIYAEFLRRRERESDDGGKFHVDLRYTGSLAPVEHAGFETTWTDGKGRATGALTLADLQRIAGLDEVVTIHYGTRHQLFLDKSIPQIRANKVRTLGSAGAFSGPTGAGAIVGVIDTGVDHLHPFLWARTIPDKATRILSIWDQGLIKVGGESEPAVGLLDAGTPGTYGVEYTESRINDVIRGKVGHNADCSSCRVPMAILTL